MQILHNKSFGSNSPCAKFAVIFVQLVIFICERVNRVFLTYSDMKKCHLH